MKVDFYFETASYFVCRYMGWHSIITDCDCIAFLFFISFCYLFAVLLGRKSGVALHVFSEKRQVWEVQFVYDFLDAFLRLLQQVDYVFHHIFIDKFGRGMSACFFTYCRKVFGSDV